MRIRLRHCATNLLLKSVSKNYIHQGTSGQQIVGADAIPNAESIWLVKGSDALGEHFPAGSAVRHGDLIRLEHISTKRNLHSHSRRSPLTGQQEVTACGEGGKADANDDWKVDLGGPGIWLTEAPMRLEFDSTGYVLHSHSGFAHPTLTAGLQEVTALPKSDPNDMWQAELPTQKAKPARIKTGGKSQMKASPDLSAEQQILVFISHSSADADLAKATAKLLQAALGLSAQRIRCTSVPGYKLPLGVDVDARLRLEVNETKVLVGLVTPASSKSAYVLFELGARWGRGSFIAPLLARGGKIKAPLSNLNALRATIRKDMFQFVREIASNLGAAVGSPELYDEELEAVVTLAKRRTPGRH
jgi:hypothetical protein